MPKCINHMLTYWRANHDCFLTIIYHHRAKYYAVVNDDFLRDDKNTPEETGCRLMLRCTFKELKKLCTYYQSTQIDFNI